MAEASARAASEGGRFSSASAGPGGAEGGQDDFLQRFGVLGQAHGAALPVGELAVGGQQAAGLGPDEQFFRSQPPEDQDVGTDRIRRDRAVVAPPREQGIGCDPAQIGPFGRIGDPGEFQQVLGSGQLPDRPARSGASVGDFRAEPVQALLGPGQIPDRRAALASAGSGS